MVLGGIDILLYLVFGSQSIGVRTIPLANIRTRSGLNSPTKFDGWGHPRWDEHRTRACEKHKEEEEHDLFRRRS